MLHWGVTIGTHLGECVANLSNRNDAALTKRIDQAFFIDSTVERACEYAFPGKRNTLGLRRHFVSATPSLSRN